LQNLASQAISEFQAIKPLGGVKLNLTAKINKSRLGTMAANTATVSSIQPRAHARITGRKA
ncbi:MAG: hypothetical protein AAFP78_11560, partial [Pseudomonadota bacterium]